MTGHRKHGAQKGADFDGADLPRILGTTALFLAGSLAACIHAEIRTKRLGPKKPALDDYCWVRVVDGSPPKSALLLGRVTVHLARHVIKGICAEEDVLRRAKVGVCRLGGNILAKVTIHRDQRGEYSFMTLLASVYLEQDPSRPKTRPRSPAQARPGGRATARTADAGRAADRAKAADSSGAKENNKAAERPGPAKTTGNKTPLPGPGLEGSALPSSPETPAPPGHKPAE